MPLSRLGSGMKVKGCVFVQGFAIGFPRFRNMGMRLEGLCLWIRVEGCGCWLRDLRHTS